MIAPDYRTRVVIEDPPRRSGTGLYLRHEGRMHQLLNTELNKLLGHPGHLTIYLGPPEALIETPTTEPTCENTCESAEPSDAELKAVRRAVIETPGWLLAEPFSGRDVAGHLADAAIRALDRHRKERRGG